MTVQIILENIGGLTGKQEFTLERGINIVEAPNAVGKTSFIRGLRAAVLPKEELENFPHFLNAWMPAGSVSVTIDGKKNRRELASRDGTLSVSGEPIFEDGSIIDTFAFAIPAPDNKLSELIQSGKSLAPLIEELSGARYYRILVEQEFKKRHKEIVDELGQKGRQVKELDRLQGILVDQSTQLESLEKALKKLPPLTSEDKDRYAKYRDLKTENASAGKLLQRCVEEIELKEGQLKNLNEGIRDFKRKHPEVDKEIDELEDLLSTKRLDYDELITTINLTNMEIDRTQQNREECITYMGKMKKISPEKVQLYCFACGHPLKSVKDLEGRLASLEKAKLVHQKAYDAIRKEVEEIEEKISWLENQKEAILHREVNLRDEVERRIEFLKNEHKKHEETLKSTTSQLKTLGAVPEHIDQYTKLEAGIQAQRIMIERINKDIEALGKVGIEYQTLKRKENFIRHAIAHMEKRAEETMRNYAATFNKNIMKMCDTLGFKDFHDIKINETLWNLEVVRRRGSRIKPMTQDYLSTSERITMSLILTLTGKTQYIPDFPLFVLDEVTLSYDPTRFERVLKYLKETVPYIIVTTLSPVEKGEQIRVRTA